MSFQVILALIIGVAASGEDLLRRNISNWIPLAALIGGIAWHMSQNSWWGIATALSGGAAGFAVFLVFYLLGGMGGGDIKLMAGFGALLGVSRLVEAAIWTGILGAVLALAVLGYHSLRKVAGGSLERPRSIPYAPAIAVGVWISLVPR